MTLERVTELLAQLVRIESINPDLVLGGAGEGEIAQFVAAWCARVGLEVTLSEPVAGRPSVVAIARGSGGGRSLMLNAHMDTVGVAGMTAPFAARVEAGRLYGRGAYDMKGSLAAIMLVAAAARAEGWRGDLLLTAVADEENASFGTQAIAESWTADAAIVTEPSHLELCVAHKGFVWLEVATQGRAAHGSRPDLGIDAIAKMGPVLVGLEELDRHLRANPRHRLLHSGSIHASLIGGGQERSSYPERCLLDIERRTIPGETAEEVAAQVQAILDRAAAADPTFQATLRTTLVRDAFEVAEAAPIVTTLRRQATALLGRAPQIVGETPWMDSAILSAAGIPTVVFGPTGAGAHAVEEWVELDSVQRCADILLATAREFCN